jgi:hypothetical protein
LRFAPPIRGRATLRHLSLRSFAALQHHVASCLGGVKTISLARRWVAESMDNSGSTTYALIRRTAL